MKSVQDKIINSVGWLMLLFCMFPYIGLPILETNTQPNALFFAIIYFLLTPPQKYPFLIKYLIFILIFVTLILIFSDFSILEIKDWGNYLSLCVITISSYQFLLYQKGDFYYLFFFSVLLWGITGGIQTYINPNFLSFLVPIWANGADGYRGVPSLASEPTYYGLICLSMLIIYLINTWYNRSKLLGIIIFIQLVVFSKSSTSFAVLGLGLVILFIFNAIKLNIKVITVIILLFFLGLIFISFFEDIIYTTRAYSLYKLTTQQPELIFINDYPINERVNHVLFPALGMYENYLIPKGFGHFGEYLLEKSEEEYWAAFFTNPVFRVDGKIRIMSGFGKGFFELGFLGLLIPVFIYLGIKPKLRKQNIIFFSITLFLLVTLMAFPFMTSIIPFIIGNLLFVNKFNEN